MTDKKSRAPMIVIFISLALLMSLLLLSGFVSLGEALSNVNLWLGILYWLTVLSCLGAGVVWPIISVFHRPIFSMYQLRDSQGHARVYWCRKLVSNLSKNTALTNEESAQLDEFLKQGDQADDKLIEFFCSKFGSIVDEQIALFCKSAFVATAVSQTALYDTLSMLSINLQQIRAIVSACGYRPSSIAIFGLYIRILKEAFLAGGLEEANLEELMPLFTSNAALKLSGLLLASVAQGSVNAFMTARAGIITKKYLFAANGPMPIQQAKKGSYEEALALLKEILKETDFKDMVDKAVKGASEAVVSSVKGATEAAASSVKKLMDDILASTQEHQKLIASSSRNNQSSAQAPQEPSVPSTQKAAEAAASLAQITTRAAVSLIRNTVSKFHPKKTGGQAVTDNRQTTGALEAPSVPQEKA